MIVLDQNDVKFQDLKSHLDIPSSTLSHYLKYLADHGILGRQRIGYENIYSIQDQRVAKVLIIFEPSLTDKIVDKVMRALMETDFKTRNGKAMEG